MNQIDEGTILFSSQMRMGTAAQFACVRCGHPLAYIPPVPVEPDMVLKAATHCPCCGLKLAVTWDNSFNGATGWIQWCRVTVAEPASLLSKWGRFWRRIARTLARIGEPV